MSVEEEVGLDIYAGVGEPNPVPAEGGEAVPDQQEEQERPPLIVVGGADAVALAYHAARGEDPEISWGMASEDEYPGDVEYAAILDKSIWEMMRVLVSRMRARGGGDVGEDEYAAEQSNVLIGKYYQPNYETTARTPLNQLHDLALQAETATNKWKALRSILGSADVRQTKMQRLTLLAASQEKSKQRIETLKTRISVLIQKLGKCDEEVKTFKDLHSVSGRDVAAVRSAIEPAFPGTSDDAHPALMVGFGSIHEKEPSDKERRAYWHTVVNTLDYYSRKEHGASCAHCRRSIKSDASRVFTCRVCVRVVYCSPHCVKLHRPEHLPVCITHENWTVDIDEAKQSREAAPASYVDLSGDFEPSGPQRDADVEADQATAIKAAEAAEQAKKKEELRLILERAEVLKSEVAEGGAHKRKREEDEDQDVEELDEYAYKTKTKLAKKGKGGKGGKGAKGAKGGKGKGKMCYSCGEMGHLAAFCPYQDWWQ